MSNHRIRFKKSIEEDFNNLRIEEMAHLLEDVLKEEENRLNEISRNAACNIRSKMKEMKNFELRILRRSLEYALSDPDFVLLPNRNEK